MTPLNQWFKHVATREIKVLAIGGSDPSGGAGIQQDIRTITVLGGYGTAIPTALTIQNTLGVKDIALVPPETLSAQLESCLSDIPFDAIKIGMMGSVEHVRVIGRLIKRLSPETPVILDPVMNSKNNKPLLEDSAIEVLKEELLPHVSIITPNIPEASRLLDDPSLGACRQEELARQLYRALTKIPSNKERAVIVKGGHSGEKDLVMDILVDSEGTVSIGGARIDTVHTHGTGCAFASCLATLVGGGLGVREAFRTCRDFMELSIVASKGMGRGIGPVNTLATYWQIVERDMILKLLKEASSQLEKHPGAGRLAPEIQINLGYALPYARTREDVAAFPGRIVRVRDYLRHIEAPEFGASSHVANIILTAMLYDPKKRSAMDIKMDEAFLKKGEALGYKIASFSRKDEPKAVKEAEGSSLVWGVKQAIENSGGLVPDLIWDDGDLGKEPAIRVLGNDPLEVVKKALSLL